MMSGSEDPKDGKAVAGTAFGAILVYGVRFSLVLVCHWVYMSVMGGRRKVKEDRQKLDDGAAYDGEKGIALQGGEVKRG